MTSHPAPGPAPRPSGTTTTTGDGTTATTGDDLHPSVARDVATVAPALRGGRQLAFAPASGATWRAVSQATIGWPWLLTVGLLVLVWVPVSTVLVAAVGLGLLLLVATQWFARGVARAEIARLSAQTGARIPRPGPPPRGTGLLSTLLAPLRDTRAWSATGYAALSVLTSTLTFSVVVALAGAGLAGVLAPAYGTGPVLEDRTGLPRAALWTLLLVGGLVALWLAALGAQAGALLQVRMARGMLGRTRAAERVALAEAARGRAEERTARVEVTRSLVVDAADDERRRIERDLHDGAQQRLVALGLELGAAKRRPSTDPQAAAVLDRAHREVRETLAELRDLVRGIHPAVLTDRGLDAALSALAARAPVPVTVRTPADDALARCGTAPQAAAYFVVAEALTNVAKHAGATAADVTVTHDDGLLRLVVHDDGRGGATAAPGSGLDGLRSRVAALDGTFDLSSPAGAGTTLTVELPCAS